MPMPVMTLANATATGDMIVGPGAVTTMVKGLPVACLGDAVAGPVCVSGVITASMSPNVLAKGRPVATIGAPVRGVSPIGVPVATVCAVTPNMNDIF